MCGFLDKLFGGDDKPSAPAPTVVRETPKADDARIQADADAKASQEKSASKQRRRRQSLLATGGAGDSSQTEVAAPAGKPTLGA